MNVRSIRFRVTIWYAAIVALTLTVFCALAYLGVSAAMDSMTVIKKLPTARVYTPEQEEDGRPVSRMVVYDAAR